MHFAQPVWFVILPFVLVAVPALYAVANKQRKAAVARFALRPLAAFSNAVSMGRRHMKVALIVLASAALVLALARPQWGSHDEERTSRGIDLMFAVDTSKSMLARDVQPDRLTRAKMAVADLTEHFAGNRVGLVAFAGRAFLACPLTLDQQAFNESLMALDTNTIPRGGTNIAAAIDAAARAFGEDKADKLLVLLTDGESLEQDALAAAKQATGLRIFTIGVGSEAGELIPVPGTTEFQRDDAGNFVKSRLDAQMLTQIAQATGGAYAPLGASGQGLEQLYREHLATLPTGTLGARVVKVYGEHFEIPLALALACLLLEMLVGERKRRFGWGAVVLFGVASSAHAAEPNPKEVYNAGVTTYRAADFKTAADDFKQTLSSQDPGVQQKAYYNLGNAQYRLGQASQPQDRQARIAAWKEAIADYEGAIALNAKDEDAVFNRDFVKKQLEALQKQPPPQHSKDDKQKSDAGKGEDNAKPEPKPGEQTKAGDDKGDGNKPDGNKTDAPKPGEQAGANGDKPESQPGQAKPDAQDGARSEASQAGQLSPSEAKALLDSLKGDDRHPVPSTRGTHRNEDTPKKDW